MMDHRVKRKRAFWQKFFWIAGACSSIALSGLFFEAGDAVSQIPPAVEKKTVFLKKEYADAELFFAGACSKCHKVVGPGQSGKQEA